MSVNCYSGKSIDQLEGESWRHPGSDAPQSLIRCFKLRSRPIGELAPSDLRVLIGQDVGLPYLVPVALDILENDPLVETEHYKGDLLAAVLRASPEYFRSARTETRRLHDVIDAIGAALERLDYIDFDASLEAIEDSVLRFRNGLRTVRR